MRARSHPDQSPRRRRLAVGALTTAAALGAGLVVAPPAQAATTDIQIIATNDFHGRILDEGAQAGAAKLAGALDVLRAENPNTVFSAAGDLIGASTFESFIQNDKPTIDALNAAGLEVSAVGNHELDQGYDDLINRVMAPYDVDTNPYGGAEWEYIAANLKMRATGEPAVPATWIKEFGDVQVGFVGAVTEDLPTLVSPAGIADIQVDGIVQSVNAEAADLVAEGADLVVMLVHEGAPSTTCETMDDSGRWADIINNVSPDVDAIVSGHTHLAYNCAFPVAQWVTEGRAVTERPVVSAGQYGTSLNRLIFTVDGATGEVTAKSHDILAIQGYPADPEVAALVTEAKAVADDLGLVPIGEIAGAFNRAQLATINATTGLPNENRGGESTIGNLVAEVQQTATEAAESGAAQIAFMNPGGLRDDMEGTPAGAPYPRELTYKEAAVVQPFANTLINMSLTGGQIKTVLEQQWQRDNLNRVATRPFLRLGVSEGFEYTYTQRLIEEYPLDNPQTTDVDESLTPYTAPRGFVTGMWLHGQPIDLAASYSVTVNSFLASGGDNFRELANGTGKRDTGKVDLAAMVDYMEAAAATGAVPVDYSQRAVEVTFDEGAPTEYASGSTVEFDVKSWSMSTAVDVKDAELVVSLDGQALGTFPVTTILGTDPYDNLGTAHVSVQLPAGLPAGQVTLMLSGAATGTEVKVPLTVVEGIKTVVSGKLSGGKKGEPYVLDVTVKARGTGAPGSVTISVPGLDPIVAPLTDGTASVELAGLPTGKTEITVSYAGNGTYTGSTTTVKANVK
jgi:5'-nucleotidase